MALIPTARGAQPCPQDSEERALAPDDSAGGSTGRAITVSQPKPKRAAGRTGSAAAAGAPGESPSSSAERLGPAEPAAASLPALRTARRLRPPSGSTRLFRTVPIKKEKHKTKSFFTASELRLNGFGTAVSLQTLSSPSAFPSLILFINLLPFALFIRKRSCGL